jgi:RimJ/RimL family protein N-acetyltransferase
MNAATPPLGPPVDSSPAHPPGPVTIAGRFGSVARLDAARDAAMLWQSIGRHDDVWTYIATSGPFASEAAFKTWLVEREASHDPYFYTVADSGGHALGILAMIAIRPNMRVIEVGHVAYGPALQRTPLATETQYLLARYVFETLGYRRYEWKCDALNLASKRAALRHGFVFEGVFRQHMITKGRNRDTAWFAMLDGEWPMRKRNFERWLMPENFDSDGRQKLSLAVLNEPKTSGRQA